MICQIQNACRGFFSKTKSLKIILLTGSNNQFRNYESEFPHFFNQLEQLLQVFFVNINLIDISFLKIQDYKIQNWFLNMMSKINIMKNSSGKRTNP